MGTSVPVLFLTQRKLPMLVDNVQDIGTEPYTNLVVRSGATFPASPLTGTLFIHGTHGLCVRGHDNQWRKVAR